MPSDRLPYKLRAYICKNFLLKIIKIESYYCQNNGIMILLYATTYIKDSICLGEEKLKPNFFPEN